MSSRCEVSVFGQADYLAMDPLLTAPLFAAGTDVPEFLPPLVALIGGAAVIGYLSSRLKVVPIVGFLVAGVLIGPEQLGIVDDPEVVDAAAEIGVILLLFTIGIEFSLDRLARISRLILIAGGLQVVGTTAVVAGLSGIGGVELSAAVFTGLLVSLSSTAIVLKILPERGELASRRGQAGLAVLIFQDLAVVAMVLVVPMLAGDSGDSGGGGPADMAIALGKAALLVAAVLVIARRIMPHLLDWVARLCAPEVFLLTLVAICFGTAWLSAALGVSMALGAFLAGLVVSESRHSTHAFGEILPVQTIFSAVFFVSIGMLLDLQFLVEHPLPILGAVAGILVLKVLVTGAATRAAGLAWATAAGTALLLAQVGEFSFVLESVGRADGLSPLDLGDDGSQGFIAATVILMIATPALTSAGAGLEQRLQLWEEARHRGVGRAGNGGSGDGPGPEVEAGRAGHVIVAGYGTVARSVVGELRQLTEEGPTILTRSPDGAAEASAEGFDVIIGDYVKRAVLSEAGIDRASLLVVADDDLERTAQVTEVAHLRRPDLAIITRPLGEPDVEELAEAGADHVVTPERASSIAVGLAVRSAVTGARAANNSLPLSTVVWFRPDRATTDCPHIGEIRAVQPSAYGCEDCLRIGSRWVHLRICLLCGHMGCCDSSPNRHARAHAHTLAHPLAASAEPGEHWAYCFLDDETISPAL